MLVGVFLFGVDMKKLFPPFGKTDWIIWGVSVLAVILSYLAFPQENPVSMIGSLIGVTALVFVAKGAVFGQFLLVIFCLFYGIQSIFFRYYGETLTYMGMSLPAAIFNIVSWLRHPYLDTAQVKVGRLTKKSFSLSVLLVLVLTTVFYFLLKALNTAELLVSTLSVATSAFAATLSFQRSPWYAVAYAANDVVLVILWGIAFVSDRSVLPILTCFTVFLVNDLHGFISWQRMKRDQQI